MRLSEMPDDLTRLPAPASVQELDLSPGPAMDAAFDAGQPFVVRGLVRHWPLVQAGLQSSQLAKDYLLAHQQDRPFVVTIGPESADGRIFYDEAMAVNVQVGRAPLPEILARMAATEQSSPQPIIYLGSIDIPSHFQPIPEARHPATGTRDCLSSIWIGTKSRIAAHNDFPDNLACVAVGRRRFTLFPPDQFSNLYLGPVDNTPAGRAISMVDLHAPDLERYPRFAEAWASALTAELEPGDALFIPSLWWHHVEGLDPFNVLVNYWWRDTPRHLGQPQDALNHALMAIRDLPADEKAIWRELFDYYVFGDPDRPRAHLPEAGRGVLGPMTAEQASRIRTFLLRALNQ